ncbi:MAG: hypothetical protein ABIK18_01400 [candidate division WOR-3 bacterium]
MKPTYQPDKRVVAAFEELEKKIDRLLSLINRLKEENKDLRQRLDELEKMRSDAVQQLNTIIDKIEMLL